VIEVIGIGKREKEEVYKLILRRLQAFQKNEVVPKNWTM
jgi:hypothetical protein